MPSVRQSFTRYVPEYCPWKSETDPVAAVGERGSLLLQPAQTTATIVASTNRVMLGVVKKTSMAHGARSVPPVGGHRGTYLLFA